MQALILDDDPNFHTRMTVSLMSRGFQVLNSMSTLTGLAIARRGALDLLIMSEVVGQQLSHSVALSAERHSPYVATILRTTRTDEDLPELYDLLPSLYGILGKGIPVEVIAKLGISGVAGATKRDDLREPIPFWARQFRASPADTEQVSPVGREPTFRTVNG